MDNMTVMLLGASADLTECPVGEFEVSRLSKKLGQPFMVKGRALTMREFDDMPKENFKQHVILKAVFEPDFKDADLASKMKPQGRKTPLTPIEVIDELFLPGEIVNLYNCITELSGFGDDAVAKIQKN
ncbi:MAG TPA: hypothetical protein VN540_08540 [Clostridia bacterium]|nr:hypothetical protein [Clostridia bacterium]